MEDLQIAALQRAAAFSAWLSNPISLLLMLPLLGSLFISLTRPADLRRIRFLAVLFSLLTFAVSILMLTGLPEGLRGVELASGAKPFAQFLPFSPSFGSGFQFNLPAESYRWLSIAFGETQSFAVLWNVGVDGISMPLIVLTTTILLLCTCWALPRRERLREYFALYFLLATGLLGLFVALDYVLFYLFWELMLIPMYFLIAGWGKDKEKAPRAAIKFFIYTLTGSVFYLIAFIAMQILSNVYSFSIVEVSERALRGELSYVPFTVRTLMFLGLLLCFAVKIPMFPFHTWLPDAHTEAPTEMSVVLAAVMLKTGGYGLIRVVYTALPDVAYQVGPLIAACGVLAIVYGGLVTLMQTDLKRMIAYSSISHMGFVVLGISAMNLDALTGSVFHMIGHGVIIATLFFLAGAIEERYGTRDIRELAGLLRLAPAYGVVLSIASFGAMGFPFLIGFWGEFLVLKGTFYNNPNWEQVRVGALDGSTFLQWCAAFAVLGVLISGVYMINMLQRVLLGTYELPVLVPQRDATQAAAVEPTPLGVVDVESTPAPQVDEAGHVLQPWRGFKLHHGLALVPLTAAMILFFWWPAPIIDFCQGPASALYMIFLSK
jgi:NADH-quinone oxidoreductase subunit M